MGASTTPQLVKSVPSELQEKYLLVRRVADSELFQRSPRLRDFLLYAADCTLENRLADVREPVIAERVFHRSLEVQGGQDSIVRAEARNLRKRLSTYFETEGIHEPVIVSMPKGGYALAFTPRDTTIEVRQLPIEEATVDLPAISTLIAEDSTKVTVEGLSSRFYRIASAVLALVALAAVLLAWHWHSAEVQLARQLHIEEPTLPFSALFSNSAQTLIVTSDTGLMQISSLAHRRISLDEYMARTYPDVPHIEPPFLIRNWNIWEYTDSREMALGGQILGRNAQFAQQISLRSGHEVQLQDFKTDNVILIGSPISNPWAQLYEDKLNFRCELGKNERIQFDEKSGSSAADVQVPTEEDLKHNRTYARVAFLPASSDTTPALLIAGTTAQSTAAAGELILSRERMTKTLRSIGVDPAGPPRFFEILIRSNDFVGGAILPEVIAWRLKPAPEA